MAGGQDYYPARSLAFKFQISLLDYLQWEGGYLSRASLMASRFPKVQLAEIALAPIGKTVVSKEVAAAARKLNAEAYVAQRRG